MKQLLLASLMGSAIALATSAMAEGTDLQALEQAARAEGAVNSVGMPDSWANWKDTWADLAKLYGLKHQDTDMSSAQEIAKFEAEKDNATADIGDVGAAFGPIAVQKGVTQPYKPSTWEQIPAWAKDVSIGSRMINARAETVAEKPAFRNAFRRRRCLIPADGFYEWEKRPDGAKQPWRITLESGAPFAFAGLWEHWSGADGSEAESCTIVTTAAADSIARIHERMPVILDRADFPAWLSGTPEEAQTLLQPCRGALRSYTVSSRVNSVRNDDASLLEPAAAPPAEKRQLDLL